MNLTLAAAATHEATEIEQALTTGGETTMIRNTSEQPFVYNTHAWRLEQAQLFIL